MRTGGPVPWSGAFSLSCRPNQPALVEVLDYLQFPASSACYAPAQPEGVAAVPRPIDTSSRVRSVGMVNRWLGHAGDSGNEETKGVPEKTCCASLPRYCQLRCRAWNLADMNMPKVVGAVEKGLVRCGLRQGP